MINIIINHDTNSIDIESRHFDYPDSLTKVRELVEYILNRAYYSGERLCLEEKINGIYTEVDRYQGLNG